VNLNELTHHIIPAVAGTATMLQFGEDFLRSVAVGLTIYYITKLLSRLHRRFGKKKPDD
jgi:Na+-driven multidrug efflux pump